MNGEEIDKQVSKYIFVLAYVKDPTLKYNEFDYDNIFLCNIKKLILFLKQQI